MQDNPLLQLTKFGQSLWLDSTRRDLVENGGLRRLIEDDGLRGMTSNPAIFEKAIGGSGIDHISQQLEDEGVGKFNQAFDKLLETLSEKKAMVS